MKSTVALFVLHILAVIFVSAKAEQKTKNCNDVKEAYSSKGFNVNDVPNKGVHGEFHYIFHSALRIFSSNGSFSFRSFHVCVVSKPCLVKCNPKVIKRIQLLQFDKLAI